MWGKRWYLRSYTIVRKWMRLHSLPGFFGIPIWDVFTFLVGELKREDIGTRANSMAYSFFLSLFPSIIFMFTLLPYIPIQDFDEVIKSAIRQIMPVSAHAFLFETVESVTSIPHGGLLSLGFVLALFFASSGMLSLMRGFEKSHEVSFKARSFIKKRGIAIGLTLLVGLSFLVSGTLIVAGNKLISFLFGGARYLLVVSFIKWFAVLLLFYSVISMIYRFGPPLKKKFGMMSPGTTLATLVSLLTSVTFTYIIDNFGTQSRIYGSLGALIVILLWMQMNSFILLAGFELNASIAVNRDLRQRKRSAIHPPTEYKSES
ncbi:MAG: YihY/virulence factor BrkB family protein [Saprospiraceae bacterium]|nr:YihY/virulence factor BrkB family protein [Saprospiraceae bacterium]